jgi:hypothetical protein
MVSVAPIDPNPKAPFAKLQFPPWWESSPPNFDRFSGLYRRLNAFDSFHYLSIVEFGYQRTESPSPVTIHKYLDNAAFFPGFPFLATGFAAILPFRPEITLALTAQFMGLLCWIYLGMLFYRWGAHRFEFERAAWALVIFPSAFYLALPYSESTFTAALLGMSLFWDEFANSKNAKAWRGAALVLAIAHGCLLSATRLVGVPLAVFGPIAATLLSPERRRLFLPGVLTGVLSSGGVVAFFAHMHQRFGDWTWHFKINSLGWSNDFSFWKLLDWNLYIPLKPYFPIPAFYISQITAPILLALMISLLWTQRGRWFFPAQQSTLEENERMNRAIWVIVMACGAFLTPFIGKAQQWSVGMIRYALPIAFLGSLLAIVLPEWQPVKGRLSNPRVVRALVAVSVLLQIYLAHRHLSGYWAT